jgi:hypothetical protein
MTGEAELNEVRHVCVGWKNHPFTLKDYGVDSANVIE